MIKYLATGLIVVLCNFYLIPLRAQTTVIHFHHLTTADGLSNNRVEGIYQDQEGFLWFATDEGLDRYDGKHFLVYRHELEDSASVASSIISSVTGDTKGNIWIATACGISCLHPYSGKFENYYIYNNQRRRITGFNKVACLPSGEVIGLIDYPGIRHPEFYKVNLRNHCLSPLILPFPDLYPKGGNSNSSVNLLNNGWIVYYSGKDLFLSKDGAKHFELLNPKQPVPGNTDPQKLFLVYADTNTCWLNNGIYNSTSQLLAFNYIDHQWKEFVIPHGIMLSQGNAYSNHCYWFSGYTSGLLKIDTHTNKYTRFFHNDNDPFSLTDNTIYGSFVDHQGTLWLATEGGLDYWNKQEDDVYYLNNKTSGFKSFGGPSWGALAEDDSGNLWMGTLDYNYHNNGLFVFDPETMQFRRYSCPKSIGNGNMPVWNILPLNGHKLLLSTQSGLYEFNSLDKRFISAGSLPFPKEIAKFQTGFTIMKRDKLGNIWFGLWKKGLIQYNPLKHSMTHFYTGSVFPQYRLPDNFVGDAAEDDHHLLWVIYRDNHVLTCIDAIQGRILKEYKLAYNGHQLLNALNCISCTPSGKIWIGTMGEGLICFNPGNGKVVLYTFSNGLISSIIYSLCTDKKGRLWLYTAKGIQCMNPSTGIFYSVHTEINSPPGSIEGAPMIVSHNNILYIGYGKSLLYFNPDSALNPIKVFTPLPISVYKLGEPISFLPTAHIIYIHPKDYYFRVSFASLDMLHGRRLQYSYRLKGFNHYWINCGNEGVATFSHLPPGDYQLQMRAIAPSLPWNGKYSSLVITVVPAFYQTKLFKTAMLILITVVLYYLIGYFTRQKYRARLAQLQREQQISSVRNRIAQDIHDDIGAGLTRISIQTELMKQNPATDKSDYQKILNIINKQTHDLIRSLGEIVWTINPTDDYLDNMIAYFRVYIHRFMEGSGLCYEVNFPEMENKRNVHPDLKRNLFLILKESLNNIVKHAHAHHVNITFSMQNDDKYILSIRDDGEGFDTQENMPFSGNGLHNMRNRAWAIGARVIYRSRQGQGTEIRVEGALF